VIPNLADRERQGAGGKVKRNQHEDGPRRARNFVAYDSHHVHIGPGGQLTETIDIGKLFGGDPVVLRHALVLHLWQDCGATADCED